MFGFGSVFAIPFVAWFNDRYGRKAAIILGTLFCIVGVALQTAAINSKKKKITIPCFLSQIIPVLICL
jgi:MFS family permease